MSRLFWKTLLGFLLTFMLASFGVLPTFTLLRHQRSLTDAEAGDRLGPVAIALCRQIVVERGPSVCRDRLDKLVLPQYAARLSVTPSASEPRSGLSATSSNLRGFATGPDGRRYQISYRLDQTDTWPWSVLHIPFEVFLLGCIGSLAFSAILVGYVVAPIRRIRSAFNELANGHLTVRVGDKVGRRRDEIADLARDFDIMASRLEQLVGARDRLLHDVSHELRSPLSRLQLSIGLARQDENRLPASLDRIEHEAVRLNQMVDELLVLSRAESDAHRDMDYFDLADLVTSVVDDVRFEAEAKGVFIELQIEGDAAADLYPMQGSAELIRRAIENVLRNAVRFSPSGQVICVTLSWEGEPAAFLVDVTDNGPGVPEGLITHIFDPFVTLDAEHAGVGLGLSIARRAVQAHQGSILAKNAPERGLQVEISLPAAPYSSKIEVNGSSKLTRVAS